MLPWRNRKRATRIRYWPAPGTTPSSFLMSCARLRLYGSFSQNRRNSGVLIEGLLVSFCKLENPGQRRGWSGPKKGLASSSTAWLLLWAGSAEFSEQCGGGTGSAGENVPGALFDRALDLWIAKLEIVFEFFGVKNPGDGNPVFFKDEIFLVDVHAFHDLAEVYARLGDGEPMEYRVCGFNQN